MFSLIKEAIPAYLTTMIIKIHEKWKYKMFGLVIFCCVGQDRHCC